MERWKGAAFEGLPVAATVVDSRGRVVGANREARRISGKPPRPGQTCRQYWRCRIPASRCPLRRALARRRPVYRALVPEGAPGRCVIERVSTLRDPGGRRLAVIVTGPATAYVRRLASLRSRAMLDPLTGVLNRGGFEALADRRGGERRRRPTAFLMIDVDGLKTVNDRFGHAAGDRVLARLGRALRRAARRTDVVGRVGGDEFAVYCRDTTPSRARALAARIQRAVREANLAEPGPALSVQVGVACALQGPSPLLRQRADRLLYRRKGGHGSNVAADRIKRKRA